MRVLAVLLAGLALVACSPPEAAKTETPAATTPAPGAAPSEFMTASGNIGCIYTPAGGTAVYRTLDGGAELSCDRVEPAYVRLALSQRGPARRIETEERGCCSGESLAAGVHWAQGPFSCDVAADAVVCSSADGHGFTLSHSQAATR